MGFLIGSICALLGIGVGYAGYAFGGFTASWFSITLLVFVYAYGLQLQGSNAGSGATNPTPLLYSPYVFPVYRFNVLSNDIEEANEGVLFYYISYYF